VRKCVLSPFCGNAKKNLNHLNGLLTYTRRGWEMFPFALGMRLLAQEENPFQNLGACANNQMLERCTAPSNGGFVFPGRTTIDRRIRRSGDLQNDTFLPELARSPFLKRWVSF
jgi:hypothetical protein